jgi:hypothetical protein
MRSSIQKRKPQWLHSSFRHPNTYRSTYKSTKRYRKSHKAMCYPAWSWTFACMMRHHSMCRATFIISWAWWAHFVSTACALACCSTFSNNRWTISIIHRASSCWAPLHTTLLRVIAAQRNLWRSWTVAPLSSSFAYLRDAPQPCLWLFQFKAKWS